MVDAAVDGCTAAHLAHLEALGRRCEALDRHFSGWLRRNDVVFAGEAIPYVLMPHLVSHSQRRVIAGSVEVMARVLNRFCEAYATHGLLQELLALPAAEHDLIGIDPGFARPLRFARLDAFLVDELPLYLEFNAESPAGIGYADRLWDGMRATEGLGPSQERFRYEYDPLLPALLDTLLSAWNDARASHPHGAAMPELPRIALIDTAASPSIPEFRIICRAATAAGFTATFGSLAEVAYDGTHLTLRGERVDLVYRRALVEDLLDPAAPEGAALLIAAARDRAVVMVNPFAARPANNKKLLALLADPRFADLVGADADHVHRVIPWTRVLDTVDTIGPEGRTVDLVEHAITHRESLVLKPASDYGGHNVAIGLLTEPAIWDGLVEAHAGHDSYVLQQYVPVPLSVFPSMDSGELNLRPKHFNINPFAFDGRYAGTITRVSDRAVINVSAGGGLMPCVVVEALTP